MASRKRDRRRAAAAGAPDHAGGKPGQPPVAGRRNRTLSRRRRWLFRLTAMTLVPAALLIAVELGLRVCGYGHSTDFLVKTDDGEAYTANEKFGWRFRTDSLPEPLRISAQKPPGAVRVFVLGESAAWGTPDPAYNFGRVLEVMLRRRYPRAQVEMINAAMMGINSHAILPIARQCARHEPDLLIVYMGNNELSGVYGVDVTPGGSNPGLRLIRASLWAKSARLGQLLARLSSAWDSGPGSQQVQDHDFFVARWSRSDDPRRERVCGNFRANLEEICELAAKNRTPLLLCTVAVNTKDCPPLGALHRADLTEAEQARWEELYCQGIAAETAGRHEQAIEQYRAAGEIDDQFSDLHFRLGDCCWACGWFDEARRHYLLARELDAMPFRADRRLNGIIREVAANCQSQGVTLVDAEQALAECEPGERGIPGDALFYEHVHFKFRGNYELARALLPAVEAALGGKLGPPADAAAGPPSLEQCAKALAYTKCDVLRLMLSMVRLTAKPPFTAQLDHDRRQRRAEAGLAALQRSVGTDDLLQAIGTYRAALAERPDDWHLHQNFAMMLFDTGDLAASAEHWRCVLEPFPRYATVRMWLAQTLARAGQFEAARREIHEALRIRPDDAKIKNALDSIEQLEAAARSRGVDAK